MRLIDNMTEKELREEAERLTKKVRDGDATAFEAARLDRIRAALRTINLWKHNETEKGA